MEIVHPFVFAGLHCTGNGEPEERSDQQVESEGRVRAGHQQDGDRLADQLRLRRADPGESAAQTRRHSLVQSPLPVLRGAAADEGGKGQQHVDRH